MPLMFDVKVNIKQREFHVYLQQTTFLSRRVDTVSRNKPQEVKYFPSKNRLIDESTDAESYLWFFFFKREFRYTHEN